MAGEIHKLRISTSRWRAPEWRLNANQLQGLADQINEKAKDRRMIGQIEGVGDIRRRISMASHIVLPTAKVRGSMIVVEIETLDTSPGRTLEAFFKSKVPLGGVLAAVTSGVEDIRIDGVDVSTSVLDLPEDTVLDDLVDALEEDQD